MSPPPRPPAPPPSRSDTRRHPRVDFYAQVQVSQTQDSEVYIMSTSNISRGGLFISGDPAEYPDLTVGASVDLSVFADDDLGIPEAHLQAVVVRVAESGGATPAGFGLEFITPHDLEQGKALDAILAAASR